MLLGEKEPQNTIQVIRGKKKKRHPNHRQKPFAWGTFLCRRGWQSNMVGATWEGLQQDMFGIRAGEFTGHKIGFSLPKQSRILLPGSIQVEWNVLRVRSLTAIFEGWQVLVCWVRLAFVASPLEDVQSSMGMKAPAFFADDCLFLGCYCMHEANCLVGTSLNLSQLRNTDSFHSAFWNHSEEYFYSSMSIATYPLWILSLKENISEGLCAFGFQWWHLMKERDQTK